LPASKGGLRNVYHYHRRTSESPLAGIKEWWGRQYAEHQIEYTDLFDAETSDKAYEEDVEITGFGLAPVKNQGTAINYDTESQARNPVYPCRLRAWLYRDL